MKNPIKIIKKRPILSGIIGLVVIVVILVVVFSGGNGDEQTMVIKRADFINQVAVSGKVVASVDADLGFDQSGRVSTIRAKVGDTVKTGTVIASIENGSAQANVEREQAKLTSTQRGTRPEELAITEQKYNDTSSALVIAMRDAYLKTEDAIVNKTDSVFTNGNTVNPEINIRTQSYTEKRGIENDRLILGEKILKWKNALGTLTISSDGSAIKSVRAVGNETSLSAKNFIDKMSYITGNLSSANSGNSQANIDTYRATVNSAGQQIATAASAEQSAYGTWTSAANSLALQKSGSTAEDIAAQSAEYRSAQAELRKTLIIAPFDGIITKMDLKIGQVVSPNASEVAIMSVGNFEIESYVPEVNIARLKIGDSATVTLDAYGESVSFAASIITIDPAETLKDGISAYKVRLRFTENDLRIKSGMTANIRVTTEKKSDTIVIPKSAIIEQDGREFVRTMNDGEEGKVEITTGSTSALGQVEVVSGLKEGDVVILPPLVVTP